MFPVWTGRPRRWARPRRPWRAPRRSGADSRARRSTRPRTCGYTAECEAVIKLVCRDLQCRAPLKRGSRHHCLPLVERSPDSVTAVGGDGGDNTNNNLFIPGHFCGSVSVKTRLTSQKINTIVSRLNILNLHDICGLPGLGRAVHTTRPGGAPATWDKLSQEKLGGDQRLGSSSIMTLII